MKTFIKNMETGINRQIDVVCKELIGWSIKIISNYNGQPVGRSRPSLKGQTRIIKHVFFAHSEFHYFIEDELCALSSDDFEFITKWIKG